MNAPLNPKIIVDPLADAREEAIRSFEAAARYASLACGHLELPDDAGAIWDYVHADIYWRSALRHMDAIRANKRENFSAGLSSKKRAFVEMAERLRSRWAMVAEAALRDEPDFVTIHCRCIAEVTREAFAAAKSLATLKAEGGD